MLASYLARLGSTWLRARGQPPIDPRDEARLSLRAWPVDIDVFLHLNNGRYLTLMDFGRWYHGLRSGTIRAMSRNGWRPIIAAAHAEFLREIRTLQGFDLVTRLATWDEKWFYMEQRFERDGVLFAQGRVRAVLKKGRQTIPPARLLEAVGSSTEVPEPGPDLRRWIESQQL